MPQCSSCRKCSLHKTAQTVCLWGEDCSISGHPDILLLGEAPGGEEDSTGRPFIGRSGSALRLALDQLKLTSRCYVTNVVKCRPPGNATPTLLQIRKCAPYWKDEVAAVKPKFIIALGATAIRAVSGEKWVTVNLYRGRQAWIYAGALVIATYHPAAALRDPKRWPEIIDDLHRCLDRSTIAPEKIQMSKQRTLPNTYAFDIETTGLNPFSSKARILTVAATNRGKGVAFAEPGEFLDLYQPDHAVIGHNIKFDLLWLRTLHGLVHTGKVLDTMCMAHLVDENAPSKSLKYLVGQYTGLPGYDLALLETLKKGNLTSVPTKELLAYNVQDAVGAWMLYERLLPEVEQAGARKLLEAQGRIICGLVRLEHQGLPIAPARLARYRISLQTEVAKKEEQFVRQWGVNPSSNPQMATLIADNWGLPITHRTPKGSPQVNEEALEEWIPMAGKTIASWLTLLLEYRKGKKILNTYLTNIEEGLDKNNRIHASYNICGTKTGRLSCNTPNLQNFPRVGGPKTVVVARPGNVLIQADYSQIELRVVALLAGDKNMLKMFRDGADIHTASARAILGREPSKEERTLTKRVNFGILYGISPRHLAAETGMTMDEATDFMGTWFATFPQIREWLRDTARDVLSVGYVSSMFGRRRHLPKFVSTKAEEQRAIRQATNFPVQSAAAELTNLAMTKIQEELVTGCVIANVHDSILVECSKESESAVRETMQYWMEHPEELCGDFGFRIKFPIPITVEMKSGKCWADL